jgi:hypothetical protein
VENDRVHTLGLSVTDVSSEELFDTWQGLLALRMRADDYLAEMRGRFERAEGLVERDRLWARLDVLWPNYQVLSAWTEVMHAAYVFATEGHESLFMDGGFFTTAEFFTSSD